MAASSMAHAVSRTIGSRIIWRSLFLERWENCRKICCFWSCEVEKNTCFLEMSFVSVMRLKVCKMRLSFPVKLRNCLGFFVRLRGHNLSPLPPAMMTGCSQSIFLEREEVLLFVFLLFIFQLKFTESADVCA